MPLKIKFENQNTNALTAGITALGTQMAQCCCDNRYDMAKGFSDLGYALATQSCETRQAIADSTRDIIDSNNAGVRSILDFLTQDKIATLQAENQSLKFAASQQAQNAFLVDQLGAPIYHRYMQYVNIGLGALIGISFVAAIVTKRRDM